MNLTYRLSKITLQYLKQTPCGPQVKDAYTGIYEYQDVTNGIFRKYVNSVEH